jgi:hypothetical protein
MSAAVAGTTFRPPRSYTTLWDVTPNAWKAVMASTATPPSAVHPSDRPAATICGTDLHILKGALFLSAHCDSDADTALAPGLDDLRARAAGRRRILVTLAFVLEAVVGSSGQRERLPPLPLVANRVAQKRSPAVADIIGARLAWTVAMISSVSIPCR